MTKPKETKILALIAAILGGVHFLLDVMAILFAEQYIPTLFKWHWELELPIFIKIIMLLQSVFSVLTVAGVSLWSYLQQTITVKKAQGILIVQGIIYGIKLIAAIPFVWSFSPIVSAYGADTLAFYSSVNTVRGFFSPLSAVALILICCSAAVELYITIHNEESTE